MADVQYRLPREDIRYGHICPVCAGPKSVQASECQRCWFDRRRTVDYWARRTCPDCGGMKSRKRPRCFRCAVERRVSAGPSIQQTASHPWRRR